MAKAKAKAKAAKTPRAKAKPAKAKPKATPAKASPKATRKPKAKATPKPARKAKAKAKTGTGRSNARVPVSPSNARLRTKPKTTTRPAAKQSGGGQIVQILDDDHPLDALRRYMATFDGNASEQQGQVALGSAQLMLFAIEREHRGGKEVQQLIDLVLSRWGAFPEPDGFHAQGFLRNAFAAIGDDTERLSELVRLVPVEASPELRYNIAAAYAFVGDKPALLPALERALDAGASPDQIMRDTDFAAFVRDPDVEAMLARASVPEIPVDIGPHVRPVRAALDSAMATLRRLGEKPTLEEPATLDRVLSIERVAKIQLPNDYRAMLTISDGVRLLDNEFFGTHDYGSETELAKRARAYLSMSASDGRSGIGACVPLANWGQPNDWLLYDPKGDVRGGAPGYLLMLNADELALRDLVHAFERLERIAEDVLGTN